MVEPGNAHTAGELIAIILGRVSFEPNSGCWLWEGTHLLNGYGTVGAKRLKKRGLIPGNLFSGSRALLHRLVWFLWNGPITGGMHVLHRCDTPACINPEHLRVGTHAENMAEMADRDRRRRKFVRGQRTNRRYTVDAICGVCSKPFRARTDLVGIGKGKTCSNSCSAISRNRRMFGDD